MYLQYIRAMGWGYTIMAFIVYFIQNVAVVGQNLWLSDWTNDATEYNNTEYPAWLRDTRVGVFGALGVAQGSFPSVFFYIIGQFQKVDQFIALLIDSNSFFMNFKALWPLLEVLLFCCRGLCVLWHTAPGQCFH